MSHARCFVQGHFENCSLKIVDGIIRQIAPSIPATTSDLVVPLEGTAILPGLINAHDHLEFNLFKRIGTPPYPNYIVWGEDIHAQHKKYIQQVLHVPLRLRLLWGAYKNIFSGVTTVVHHNDFYFDFRFGYPLEVHRNYHWIHSLALDKNLEKRLKSWNGKPSVIHLAEGVDELAGAELSRLVELGGLRSNTVLVHGVGLSKSDVERIANAGASLVWCPSSNEFLFDRTAPLEHMFGRIRIALGTDSTLTGNASLFDEIRCAIRLKNIDPLSALTMVTSLPANIFRMDKGVIAEGKAADLLLYDCEGGDPLNAFLHLDLSKIQCLMRKGVPLYGDASLVRTLRGSGGTYTNMNVSGRRKMVIGNFRRLTGRISLHLPDFDFNGLPIEIDHESRQ